MAWYPRDNDAAPGERRWAILTLLVAPTGDFSAKTVAHAERHFQLACCSRAVQGHRQSSNITRLLHCSVPWDTRRLAGDTHYRRRE